MHRVLVYISVLCAYQPPTNNLNYTLATAIVISKFALRHSRVLLAPWFGHASLDRMRKNTHSFFKMLGQVSNVLVSKQTLAKIN